MSDQTSKQPTEGQSAAQKSSSVPSGSADESRSLQPDNQTSKPQPEAPTGASLKIETKVNKQKQDDSLDNIPPSAMTNEERLKVYAKKLFANRDVGFLIYRNAPPSDANKQNSSKSVQSGNTEKAPQKGAQSKNTSKNKSNPTVNPVASTMGSKIFGRPDFTNLEVDSSLQLSPSSSKTPTEPINQPSDTSSQCSIATSSKVQVDSDGGTYSTTRLPSDYPIQQNVSTLKVQPSNSQQVTNTDTDKSNSKSSSKTNKQKSYTGSCTE